MLMTAKNRSSLLSTWGRQLGDEKMSSHGNGADGGVDNDDDRSARGVAVALPDALGSSSRTD